MTQSHKVIVEIQYELLVRLPIYSIRRQYGTNKPHGPWRTSKHFNRLVSTDRQTENILTSFRTWFLIAFIFVSCKVLMDSIKGMIHDTRFPSTTVRRSAAAVITPVMKRDDNRISFDYFSAYRRRKLFRIKTCSSVTLNINVTQNLRSLFSLNDYAVGFVCISKLMITSHAYYCIAP